MYILNKDAMYISGAQLGDNRLKVGEMLQSILSNFKSIMGTYLIRRVMFEHVSYSYTEMVKVLATYKLDDIICH